MPSGRTHDRITLWGLPWVVAIAYGVTRDGELTLVIALAYLFSGLMFGPDLDIHSVQFKRWGLLRWIWLPYQKTLRHRSRLSHGFIVGTTVRVMYFSLILGVAGMVGVAIAQGIFGFTWNWQTLMLSGGQQIKYHYGAELLALFVGLETGSMSHSLSDWLGSTIKLVRKKGWTSLLPQKKTKGKTTRRRRATPQVKTKKTASKTRKM